MKNGLGVSHFIIGLRIDFEAVHTREMFDQRLHDAHCLDRLQLLEEIVHVKFPFFRFFSSSFAYFASICSFAYFFIVAAMRHAWNISSECSSKTTEQFCKSKTRRAQQNPSKTDCLVQECTLAREPSSATPHDWWLATRYTVPDKILQRCQHNPDVRRLY
jgi:hypothetical protein